MSVAYTGNRILPLLAAMVLAGIWAIPAAQADTFGSGANEFTIDFVTIGNAGNADDTTGYGGVGYTYRIGTYEISEQMITKANALGGLGITLDGRGPDKPATDMSWNEAARFVNWLNASEGYTEAYKFEFQPGEGGYFANSNIMLWEPGDAGYDPANLYRNADAHYFLPSEDEWYKAAYYSGSTYYDYATQQDVGDPPTAVASGTGADEAVYDQLEETGPADITLAGGESAYGTVGQSGNAFEWAEDAFFPPNDTVSESRVLRGGAWLVNETFMRAENRYSNAPGNEGLGVGFRVASVPEPSSGLLLMAAGGVWLIQRRRRPSL